MLNSNEKKMKDLSIGSLEQVDLLDKQKSNVLFIGENEISHSLVNKRTIVNSKTNKKIQRKKILTAYSKSFGK